MHEINGIKQFRVNYEIDLDEEETRLDSLIPQIQKVLDEHPDATYCGVSTKDRDGDSSYAYLDIYWWRPATEEEIVRTEAYEARKREEQAQREAAAAAHRKRAKETADARALATARKAFPDLFKEETT